MILPRGETRGEVLFSNHRTILTEWSLVHYSDGLRGRSSARSALFSYRPALALCVSARSAKANQHQADFRESCLSPSERTLCGACSSSSSIRAQWWWSHSLTVAARLACLVRASCSSRMRIECCVNASAAFVPATAMTTRYRCCFRNFGATPFALGLVASARLQRSHQGIAATPS